MGPGSFHIVRRLAEEPFGSSAPFKRHGTRFPGTFRILKTQAVAQVLNELEPQLHAAREARREVGAHRIDLLHTVQRPTILPGSPDVRDRDRGPERRRGADYPRHLPTSPLWHHRI